jgi:hypothetical protein
MGPYCNFCNNRCFVYMPEGTPEHIVRAYGTSTLVATCLGGQRFEKEKTGYCYSDIMEAKQARRVPENTSGRWFCRQCGLAINQGYSWNGLCVVCARPYLEEV